MDIPIALAAGFVLDLLLGDPRWLPHSVVVIGKAIAWLERLIRAVLPASPGWELAGGAVAVLCIGAFSFCVPFFLLAAVREADARAGLALECFFCYQALATKCLRDAGRRVYDALAKGDLAEARRAVGMIVGRDTEHLDEQAVVRATVETVAENASDGVVAPMLYFAIGGAPLAMLYKGINTMDSMLGYKNARYLYFGRAAARLDDVANFIPARLTALAMLPAAALCGLDWRGAARMYRRDRNAHTSPNAGHPEAACAGALGLRLGGDSLYGGTLVTKPSLGDPAGPAQAADILRVNRLLYGCAALVFAALFALRLGALHFAGAGLWS